MAKAISKTSWSLQRIVLLLIIASLLVFSGCTKTKNPINPDDTDPVTEVEDEEEEIGEKEEVTEEDKYFGERKEVIAPDFSNSSQGAMEYVVWLINDKLGSDWGSDLILLQREDLNKERRFALCLLFSIGGELQILSENSGEYFKEELFKYLTNEELEEWCDENSDTGVYDYNIVFSAAEVQQKIDDIWGPGVVAVDSWKNQERNLGVFTSATGHVIFSFSPRGYDLSIVFYNIIEAQALKNSEYVVRLQMIAVFEDDDIYDFSSNIHYNWEVAEEIWKADWSFAEATRYLNFKKAGVIEIVVKHTKDGMRLQGRKPENAIVAYEVDVGKWYTVNASGGLRLRRGPGTKYDIISVIPNGSVVFVCGSLKNNNSWYYVSYNDEKKGIRYGGGWVAAQYLK